MKLRTSFLYTIAITCLYPQISFATTSPEQFFLSITEIFPNPIGEDKNKEFYEITNKSSQDIDLSSYTISNSNKTESFKNIIIKKNESKTFSNISIKNENETLTLKLNNKEISNLSFEESIEGLSINKTQIKTNNKYKTKNIWTSPNPGKILDSIEEKEVTILEKPNLKKNIEVLAKDKSNQIEKYTFDETIANYKQINEIFLKNTIINIVIEKNKILDYKIIKKISKNTQNNKIEISNYFLLIPIICLIILLITIK